MFPIKKVISIIVSGMFLIFATAGCQTGENAVTAASGPLDAGEPVSASKTEDDSQIAAEPPVAEEEPEPDNNWEFDAPENHGVDGGILESLHEAVKETDIYSILIVKDGFIIDEYYKEGYDENSVFRLASCSKTFTGALIGIAIDQGLISGVDAKLTEYLPQLADLDDPLKKEITIKHLLTHTSGLEWYEWGNGTSFRDFVSSENWVDYVLGRRMVAQPGTYFAYTTGGSHLLAAVLEQAVGESAYEFGKKHIFDPLGMNSVAWRTDPQGVTDGGNGISMNVWDAAKFGQLYLDGGRWRGRQIVPEVWAGQSTSTQDAGPGGRSGTYGFQWWIRPFGEGNYDTHYAMGHAGQFIFVVPELDLVTVITSRFPQNTYAPWPYFTDYILAACTERQETLE